VRRRILSWWPPADRRGLGRFGERAAERYLRGLGYRPIERNLRLGRGELDLVMREGETLCFIEVKVRRHLGAGDPLEAVDPRKQAQLVRLAQRYLSERRLGQPPCRFDVIAARPGRDGKPEWELVRGAFSA
jgi:putative endonuclease